MRMIAAVDGQWGIGCRGELLVRIPQDQKRFRSLTMGGVIVGGRRTMEGLPGRKALDGRKNILLTGQKDYQYPGAVICHSVPEVLEEVKKYPGDHTYIIGGGEVYREFLPYCELAYITKICSIFEADTFFPNLDEEEGWEAVETERVQEYGSLKFYYVTYQRKQHS